VGIPDWVNRISNFTNYLGIDVHDEELQKKAQGLLKKKEETQSTPRNNDNDLNELIATAECLNFDPKCSNVYTLLTNKTNNTILKSDCDEQLLINITFKQNVTLFSYSLKGGNDGTSPKEIELFVNKLNMGFNNINQIKPTFSTIHTVI